MLNSDSQFEPDWFSPPGATILAAMDKRQITSTELASSLGLSLKETKAMLLGDRVIDKALANKLASILGGSSAFWSNRQENYERNLKRCMSFCKTGEIDKIAKKLPLKDMRKLGWVSSVGSIGEQTLAFFDIRSANGWRNRYENRKKAVAFRQSASLEGNPDSTIAWLRQAERLASLTACKRWNRNGFREELQILRKFTKRKRPHKFFPDLVERCASHGVAVVFVPTPTGCRASGATFFTEERKAVIVLSFRFLADDQFWFSFFHEAAHLILHDERALFLEDSSGVTEEAEREANAFASDLLVPSEHRAELESLPSRSNSIMRFAVRMGVSPGVIVGQMQHLGVIKHSQMNGLKRRYSREELMIEL